MRLRYIDLAKGCAIILMIFAHTMTKINCLHIWIYSFHMPMFFIICGILVCEKEKNFVFFSRRMEIQRIYIRDTLFVLGRSPGGFLYRT